LDSSVQKIIASVTFRHPLTQCCEDFCFSHFHIW
jgi:hypothetical protein